MDGRKKRVLVVSQHYWPENFRITDICKGFLEDGIECDVLCGLPNYPKGEWFDGYSYRGPRREMYEGVELFRSGEIRRRGNTSLRIFLNYVSFPLFALFHLPRLHGRRYDAVLCYNTSPVLMMIPAIVYAKLHRVPLTTYVLDLWPENLYSVLPVKNRFLRSVAQGVSHWLYRRSDRLIALSDAMADKLRAAAPKSRITVIPQYCEELYLQDVHDEALEQRFSGAIHVLFAGNISPAQDLTLLVECARRLAAEDRHDIRFVIVGDGMSRADLEREIRESGVSEYFLFEGMKPVTDIPAYHTAADALFAALAKSDDLGLTVPAKITSYMAAGRPCLVAVDGEASRVVDDAQCGLTCAAGDADALYANLVRLAAMPESERQTMGENGRTYFCGHFRRGTLLRRLEEFILSQ